MWNPSRTPDSVPIGSSWKILNKHRVSHSSSCLFRAIAGVLTSIAIPNYSTLMANSRASTYANQLMSDLRYARSLAIMENNTVTICQPTALGASTCDNTSTSQRVGLWCLPQQTLLNAIFNLIQRSPLSPIRGLVFGGRTKLSYLHWQWHDLTCIHKHLYL